MKPGFERPDPRAVGPAGIVTQLAHHRDACQRLTADRAGIGELPTGLRAHHPAIDQPFLGEPSDRVAVMVLRAEELVREPYRAAPERERAVRDPAVEICGPGEAIVFVVLRGFQAG